LCVSDSQWHRSFAQHDVKAGDTRLDQVFDFNFAHIGCFVVAVDIQAVTN